MTKATRELVEAAQGLVDVLHRFMPVHQETFDACARVSYALAAVEKEDGND